MLHNIHTIRLYTYKITHCNIALAFRQTETEKISTKVENPDKTDGRNNNEAPTILSKMRSGISDCGNWN